MLNKELLERQKNLLISEKERLEGKIKQLKEYPDYGDIGDDLTQELVDYENNRSIGDQLNTLLKKVNRALKAIEDGSYGKCRQCSEAIESGRLKNVPYADLCITCQGKNGK